MDDQQTPLEQCNDLAEPMGRLVGAGAAVPAGAGALIATAETGPFAIAAGGGAAVATYDSVSNLVENAWPNLCNAVMDAATAPPLDLNIDLNLPPPPEAPASTPDLVSADPFGGSDYAGVVDHSSSFATSTPSYDGGGGSDGGYSGGGDYGGGGGGDGGGGGGGSDGGGAA
jgi:hypothetical protein